MPTLGNYYIDAPTFSDATAVYTDVALTTKAADGYYQSGGVYRQQLLGVLTAGVTLCPTCNKGVCGVSPTSSWITSQYGVYDFDIELGTGTGAWRIVLSPGNIPNGIFVTYDGDSYPNTTSGTKIYSSVFGALDGPYVGDNTAAAGYGFPSATGIYELPVLAWDGNPNGSTFSLTGTTETIGPITAVDFSGTAGSPGECNIFVRKQNAEPQTATIRVIGPVGGAADNFDSGQISFMNRTIIGLSGKSFLVHGSIRIAIKKTAVQGLHLFYGRCGLFNQCFGQFLVVDKMTTLQLFTVLKRQSPGCVFSGLEEA